MPADFSAKQIRVSQLMASGGIEGTTAGLLIYSASNASDLVGGFPASLLTDVGSDVYIFVSGTRDGKDRQEGVSLFGGDVVVSGTLYAEKSVIEVNKTTTGSLTISGSLFVSRSAEIRQGIVINSEQGSEAADDTRIITVNKSHALFIDASTDQFLVFSDGTDAAVASDVSFFVSGAIGAGSGTLGHRGNSLFGGDVTLSGSLHTADYIYHLADRDTFIRLQDDAINVQAGGVNFIQITEDGSQDKIVFNEAGADVDFRIETAAGPEAVLVDASANIVYVNKNKDAVTLEVYNDNELALSTTATELVVNENANGSIDFRVESLGEDEAIFVDASDNTLYINKGETSFTTQIHNDDDVAITVLSSSDSSGVVINEDGHANIDFRVETDTMSHGLFVDAGNEKIIMLSGSGGATSFDEAAASGVTFYVSGAKESAATGGSGVSIFGGDVVLSGSGQIRRGLEVNADMGSADFIHFGSSAGKEIITAKASTSQVLILAGGGSEVDYTDLAFFVSGSIGSRGTAVSGTAVFGGDVYVSGALYSDDLIITDDVTIGDDLVFNSDGAKISFGVDGEVTLLHVHDTGLLLSDDSGIGTTKLMLGDSATFIQQQADGELGIDADSIINVTAPTVDIDASTEVNVSNALTVSGIVNVAEYIKHIGDDNTTIRFEEDKITLAAGGVDYIKSDANETTISINPDQVAISTVIQGTGKLGVGVEATTNRVLILSGGAIASFDEASAADISFYVSGAVGERGTDNTVRGTSVFGGDTVVSGNLHFLKSATGSHGLALQSDSPAGQLQIGAGLDLRAYVASDDGVFENITSNKDIIFKVNNGGHTKEVARFDGSAHALLMEGTSSLQFNDSQSYINSPDSSDIEIVATDIVLDAGTLIDLQSDAVHFGENSDTDVVLTFNANSADGTISWMEDEDYFKFDDDILLNTEEKILLRDTGLFINSPGDASLSISSDGILTLTGSTRVQTDSPLTASKGLAINSDTAGGSAGIQIGAGLDFKITVASDDAVLENITSNKDMIFKGNSGGHIHEIARFDGSAHSLMMAGSSSIQFGDTGTTISQTSDGVLLVTADGTLSLEGGVVETDSALTSSFGLSIDSDGPAAELQMGAGQDLRVFVDSTNDAYFDNVTSDSDIIFRVNDSDGGGVGTEVARFDASESSFKLATANKIEFGDDGCFINRSHDGNLSISSDGHLTLTGSTRVITENPMTASAGLAINADSAAGFGKLQMGAGLDFQIGVVSANDAVLENVTTDKDIIFKVSDDGASTEVARFVGADAALKIASGKKIMFADSGENISGNGTNLTISSGGDIVLDATGQVEIPANKALHFDGAAGDDKISSDDTDLTISSGGDIILAPTGQDILPASDNTTNLGSASKRWANVYTGDLHLRNDRGDWTIIEEREYLSVRNNHTGKMYKMLLEPITED